MQELNTRWKNERKKMPGKHFPAIDVLHMKTLSEVI